MMRRASRFLPGKSLIITPVRIVNNPCPGTPGTERSAPTTMSINPTMFFNTETKNRKTGFLIGRSVYNSLK